AGREDRVSQLAPQGLKVGRSGNGRTGIHNVEGRGVSLVEVIVAPHSQVEGHSLKELNFRKKYGLTAVALWRDGRSYRTDVANFQLQFGDALLMVGSPDRFNLLRAEPDYLVLSDGVQSAPSLGRARLSVAITV